MAEEQQQQRQNLFKRINSVYFLSVKTDDGRPIFQIPMWTVVVGIILLVVLITTGRKRPAEDEED
ncbi:MAG TPA: hypothetical protein VKR42_01090 [Ktedonobacteraceae bacterium]|nr:hypothetical protein [Ktedonobacteraceae bacterium]